MTQRKVAADKRRPRSPLRLLALPVLGLASVLAVAVVGTALLLFTESGFRATLSFAERLVPTLKISSVAGNLLNFTLEDISFTLPGVDIKSRKLHLALGAVAPTRKSLSIAAFDSDGLRIKIDTTALGQDAQESAPASPASFSELPLTVALENLQFSDTVVSVDDTAIALNNLELKGSAAGKTIAFETFRAGDLVIDHGAAADAKTVPAPETKPDLARLVRELDTLLSAPLLKSLPEVEVPLDVAVSNFSLAALTLNDQRLAQNVSFSGGIQNGTFTLSQLTIESFGISARLQGSTRFSGTWPVSLLADINAPFEQLAKLVETGSTPDNAASFRKLSSQQGAVAHLSFKGELLGTLEASLKARILRMGVEAVPDAAESHSTARVELSAKAELARAGLPFAVELRSSADPEVIAGIISSEPLREARITALSLSGQGSWQSYAIQAEAALSAANLPEPLQASVLLDGTKAYVRKADVTLSHNGMQIAATASGRADDAGIRGLAAGGTLRLTGIDLEKLDKELARFTGSPAEALKGARGTFGMGAAWSLTASNDLSVWKADLSDITGSGTISSYPINMKGSLGVDSAGRINAKNLALSAAGNTLTADISMTGSKLSGTVRLEARHLKRLLPALSGTLSADARLTGTLEHPDLSISAQAQELALAGAKISRASLSAHIFDGLRKKSTIAVKADGASASDVRLGSTRLSFAGTLERHTLDLVTSARKGTINGALNLVLAGGLDASLATWHGALSSASLQTPVGNLRSQKNVPLAVQVNAARIIAQPHCWTLKAGNNARSQDAKLCFNSPLTISQTGSADVTLRDLPLNSLAAFLPESFVPHGTTTTTARIRWDAPDPKAVHAVLKLSGHGTGFSTQLAAGKADVTFKTLEAQLDFAPEKLSASLSAALASSASAGISAAVEIDDPLAARRFSGSLRTHDFDLAALNPIIEVLSPTALSLAGVVDIDLSPRGTLESPELQGTVSVQKLLVHGPMVPFAMRESTVAISLEGKRSTLTGRIATEQGDLRLSGAADWTKPSAIQAEVSAQGKNLEFVFAPYVTARVTPDVTVKATGNSLDLSGSIDIPWARIDIETLPANAVAVSKDEVIVEHESALEEKVPRPQPHDSALKVHSTLNIRIGNDIRLSAFGLKTKLAGTLLVAQDDDQLGLSGQLNLDSGSFRAYGQDLLIEKGVVTFSGPAADPTVNIEAIRNPDSIADDVTAGVRVTGRVSALKTELFSDPAMDQSSILSYVLRGQGPQATTDDNALLTSALINIGLGQTSSLVSGIGEMLRIRDLGISTAGVGDDSQVVVSGYVLPGLQVKYAMNIFDSLATLTLRYRLLPRLYLEASSGLTQTVDLLYNFEF